MLQKGFAPVHILITISVLFAILVIFGVFGRGVFYFVDNRSVQPIDISPSENLNSTKPAGNTMPVATENISKEYEGKIHIVLPKKADVYITIDGENALKTYVSSTTGHCNWDIYELVLNKGQHVFEATGKTNDKSYQKNFVLDKDYWFHAYEMQDRVDVYASVEPLMCE